MQERGKQGKFEQAVINILQDTKSGRRTRRAHRDAVGWGSVLSRYMGPGYLDPSQLEGGTLMTQFGENDISSNHGSTQGMNGRYRNKNSEQENTG